MIVFLYSLDSQAYLDLSSEERLEKMKTLSETAPTSMKKRPRSKLDDSLMDGQSSTASGTPEPPAKRSRYEAAEQLIQVGLSMC